MWEGRGRGEGGEERGERREGRGEGGEKRGERGCYVKQELYDLTNSKHHVLTNKMCISVHFLSTVSKK